MKPEQLEIDRLRKEVAKLKAERDILKFDRIRNRSGGSISRRTPQPTSRRKRYEVRFHREAPFDLAGIVDL